MVGGRILVGSRTGLVTALDAESGCIHWIHQAEGGVCTAISVASGPEGAFHAYFGDDTASIYAVDFASGERRWRTVIEKHPDAKITGAPAVFGGRLYVGVSSIESGTAADPSYECCTFRGSVVALDAATGERIWKTYTFAEEPKPTGRNRVGTRSWGPSGAAVWSAPTLDPENNTLFVGTGNSYSNPPAPESDALIALEMGTGAVRWVTQRTAGDAWNKACCLAGEAVRANCPADVGPDFDFGSSPVLTTTSGGEPILIAGQKSGLMHGLDPRTGEIRWQTRVAAGGTLGGIEWGFATDGELVYVAVSDATEKEPGAAGGLVALRVDDGEVVWHAPPVQGICSGRKRCHSAQPAAVALIPGVVFSGSLDGHLRAYAADTGKIIWDVDTVGDYETVNGVKARGGSLNGPGATVVDGMLYIHSGYSSYMTGNVLLAFSVDGQ